MSTQTPAALKPLRILDLSQGVAGAYCTKFLAGFGAEVIKVEPPDHGDSLRSVAPFWKDQPHPETSCLHLHLNAGKKSVTLDLSQPSDAELFRKLVPSVHAVVESFPPGYMEEHGLGYDALRQLNPTLVMASITPFGQAGPYRDWKANELVSYALGGYAHITGLPEREPIKSYGYLVQYHAGMHAAVGTLGALWRSYTRGMGEWVDVAVHDAVGFVVSQPPLQYLQTGVVVSRVGTRNAGSVRSAATFSEVLPCADGYLHVHSPIGPTHHNGIAELLGEPRWLEPEMLEKLPPGKDIIDGFLLPWLQDKTREELMWAAQKVNGPWTPVLNMAEVLADPQHEARGFFVDVDHPVVGKVRQPGHHFVMGDTPWRTERAPLLGEHNQEVLSQLQSALAAVQRERDPGHVSAGPIPRPLAGIRVLDLSQGVVGPVGGGVIADLGAQVIRIEQPVRAAAQRRVQTQARQSAPTSIAMAAFNVHHHDKLHLSLDLRQPEGLEVFKRLIKASDVIFENFRPRVMSNFGLECPAMQEINPGIIHVAMPAFGYTGPYRDLISQGPGVDAISGLCDLTGYPDGPPLKPGNYYADYMNGLLASYCILTGLFARAQTGRGQHIEAPMREAETHAIGEALLDFTLNGRVQTRQGNRHPSMAPHNVYPCSGDDRWVAIAVEDDQQWQALVKALGSPAWAQDTRFATTLGRHQHQEEIDQHLAQWTKSQDHRQVMELLQQAGVPAGAVLHPDEVLKDPQFQHRGYFRDIPETEAKTISLAWQYASTPMPVLARPPEFGQDNDWVLQELLDLPADQVQLLKDKNIISYGLPD